MSTAGFEARTGLSGALRQGKTRAADGATEAFLLNHPGMLARLGERARRLGREDAGYHIDFLAGAVESGNPAAFGDYIRWVVRVLTPRGLPSSMVSETLLQIENGFRDVIPAEDQLTLRPYIVEGLRGCSESPADTMLFNISMARELVREARVQRTTLSVIVGGAAFRAAPDLWREVDADSRADDVRAAVAAMRETTRA